MCIRDSYNNFAGSDRDKPQYKSLLDAPYMSRDLAEKLDELSNPHPVRPKSLTRRANTLVLLNKATLLKQRPTARHKKRPPLKASKTVSSI